MMLGTATSRVIGLASILAGLSALGMAAAAFVLIAQPIWLFFGFEIVVFVSAVLGVLLARSGKSEGPGLAIASVGVCWFVATVLGGVAAQKAIAATNVAVPTWFSAVLLGRLALSGLVLLMAVLHVWSRSKRSWVFAFRAAAFLVPFVVLAALVLWRGPVVNWLNSENGAGSTLRAAILGFTGLVGVICLAGGAHSIIRSFEVAREDAAA